MQKFFFNDRGAGDPIGFSHGWPLSSDAWEGQVPLARAIKNEIKIPVVAVGWITGPAQAEEIVSTGDADLIAARAALYDPRWPWHAAAVLGGQVSAPPQYLRSQPAQYKNLFRS